MPWEHGLQEFNVMIKKDEILRQVSSIKPHGVKGEVSFTFTDDIFDRVDCEYLVCLLDGIFVPFFIEEYRFRSDTTALVKLREWIRQKKLVCLRMWKFIFQRNM